MEAIQHAVPVVAVPFGLDQFRNAAYLVRRAKMGVELTLTDITEEDLYLTITDVLNNTAFRENAIKMRTLINDKPVAAKELFLYWVNYVIRHKGAKHLISLAVNDLNLMQYHSLDVLLFIFVILLLLVSIFVGNIYCILRFCVRRLCGAAKSRQA